MTYEVFLEKRMRPWCLGAGNIPSQLAFDASEVERGTERWRRTSGNSGPTPIPSASFIYDDPQISVSSEYYFSTVSVELYTTRLFSGHRRDSYICTDDDELVELRACQRTYNGAYVRTVLGILSYSLTVLKLFDPKFYRSTPCLPFLPDRG